MIILPTTMHGYLFDFGEGTLGQIRRHFGIEAGNKAVSNIKMMLLSHMHADHHLGFFSLAKQWLSVSV
jgi:ribonuclease Z